MQASDTHQEKFSLLYSESQAKLLEEKSKLVTITSKYENLKKYHEELTDEKKKLETKVVKNLENTQKDCHEFSEENQQLKKKVSKLIKENEQFENQNQGKNNIMNNLKKNVNQ